MAELVDWQLAERIAVRAAGREPLAESYHWESLAPDFEELTALAEELVAAETGLHSLAGPARGKVTDRAGWVRANISSFQRLLTPLTERMAPRVSGPTVPIMRAAAAAEIGLLLGWMSGRVLGQYDLLVAGGSDDEPAADADLVYYVGPNVLALEKKFGFPPREFRLWLALHEVTHRAQFTGVPWLREHYLGLVSETLGEIDPDPKRIVDGLRRAVEQVRAGQNPLAEGGIAALFATEQQRGALQRIGGMMSLLEGHGDVTMDRAAADRIPSAERFSRVLRQRRKQASPGAKLVQQLIGLSAKLDQYAQGEAFIAAVEGAGGQPLLRRAWEGPEQLPSVEEIRAPELWIERVRSNAAAVAD